MPPFAFSCFLEKLISVGGSSA